MALSNCIAILEYKGWKFQTLMIQNQVKHFAQDFFVLALIHEFGIEASFGERIMGFVKKYDFGGMVIT